MAKKMEVWDLITWHKSQENMLLTGRGAGIKKLLKFHHQAGELLRLLLKDSRADTVESVASFVESFDARVDHPWRLSDVVRLKFNLMGKNRVRINHACHDARARAEKARFMTLPGA